jgi:hypothetical protein
MDPHPVGGTPTVDDAGNVWVADRCSNLVRKITPDGDVTSIGSGQRAETAGAATEAAFCEPTAVWSRGTDVFVVNRQCERRIAKIDREGQVTLLSRICPQSELDLGLCPRPSNPGGLVGDGDGNLYLTTVVEERAGKHEAYGESGSDVMKMVVKVAGLGEGPASFFAGTPNNPAVPSNRNLCRDGAYGIGQFGGTPTGITIDDEGTLYVADAGCGVRTVALDGTITTIEGTTRPVGIALAAGPYGPQTLFVAQGHLISAIDRASGAVSPYAGSTSFSYGATAVDGRLSEARFWTLNGLAASDGGPLVAVDRYNHRVRLLFH